MLILVNFSLKAQNYGYLYIEQPDTTYEIYINESHKILQNSYREATFIELYGDTLLKEIPDFIFKFENIEVLEIDLQIRVLPKEIEIFKNLKYLGCICPLQEGIEFDISKLDSLTEVAIINTKFKKIPKKLFNPSNLDFLILGIYNVKRIRFPYNNNIKGISFYNAKNQKLHKSICNLVGLERGFSHNEMFKKIPKCVDKSKVSFDEY